LLQAVTKSRDWDTRALRRNARVAPADAIDIHADAFDRLRPAVKVLGGGLHDVALKERSMKKLIIATAAALVLGAPLALAANTTATINPSKPPKQHETHVTASSLSDRCTALGAQFDKAEATHKTSKNYNEALGLRSEGKSLCSAHKETDGIKKIESALSMIGVKPMVKG